MPADFDGPSLPTLRGEGRATREFKPNAVVAEVVAVSTHGGPGPDRAVGHVLASAALDGILLTRAQFDETACWPAKDPSRGDCCAECHASRTGEAISFAAFAPDSLGCGVSWPPVKEKASAEIAISKGVLDDIAMACLGSQPDSLPDDYDPHPKHVEISVRLTWIGPALR